VAVTEKEALTFDLATLSQLDFSQPDLTRFPCLRLAYEAAEAGGKAPIALNAADEIAVAAFLNPDPGKSIPFMGIPRTIEDVLIETSGPRPTTIQQVLEADLAARECALEVIARQSTGVLRNLNR
jgi:1-deoxy-D-xylulose-5-phosphate reductoisomerase